MAISDAIPPTRPIALLFVRCSLKITTDNIEVIIITLPFTKGKKSWLGSIPTSFRFIKFIAKVHPPQTRAKMIVDFGSFTFVSIPLFNIKLKIIANAKATNKNPVISGL